MWRIVLHSNELPRRLYTSRRKEVAAISTEYLYKYKYIAATLASTNMEIVSISSIRHDVDWCLIPYDPPIIFPDSVWLGVWGVVWLSKMIRWLKDYGCDYKPEDKLMASWQPDQFVQPSGMMAISRWLGGSWRHEIAESVVWVCQDTMRATPINYFLLLSCLASLPTSRQQAYFVSFRIISLRSDVSRPWILNISH